MSKSEKIVTKHGSEESSTCIHDSVGHLAHGGCITGIRGWVRDWIKNIRAGSSQMFVMYFDGSPFNLDTSDTFFDSEQYDVLEKMLVNKEFSQLILSVEPVRVQTCGNEQRVKVGHL